VYKTAVYIKRYTYYTECKHFPLHTRKIIETKRLRHMVRSWVYLPHGQGAHVSHENDIILLYRPVCIPTVYIRRFVIVVRSRHTREKKTLRNRIRRRKRKKKFTKPIKMPTALSSTLRTTTINVKSIVNRNSRALITKHRLHYRYNIILNPWVRITTYYIIEYNILYDRKYNNVMNAIDLRGAFFHGHKSEASANSNI